MLTGLRKSIAVLLVLGFTLASCSSGPPPSCGEEIGGVADTARFDQYFSSMNLVQQNTGAIPPEGESGAEFPRGAGLTIQFESKSDVEVRICIQPLDAGDDQVFNQNHPVVEGEGSINLGAFKPGNYVVRVIVDGVLIKNFPFSVQEG